MQMKIQPPLSRSRVDDSLLAVPALEQVLEDRHEGNSITCARMRE